MSACKCREDRSPFPRTNNYAHRDNPSSFFRMHSKRPHWYKHCLVFSLTPNWSLKVSFHKDPILSLVPYSMIVSCPFLVISLACFPPLTPFMCDKGEYNSVVFCVLTALTSRPWNFAWQVNEGRTLGYKFAALYSERDTGLLCWLERYLVFLQLS